MSTRGIGEYEDIRSMCQAECTCVPVPDTI